MLGAQHFLAGREQLGELVAGPSRIAGLRGPVGEPVPGGQGIGVVRTQSTLARRQQRHVLVPGSLGVASLGSPVGQAGQ